MKQWSRVRKTRLVLSCLLAVGVGALPRADAQTAPTTPQNTAPHIVAVSPQGPAIDLVFALDATSSMGDEIEPVKQQIWTIASRIASGNPHPQLRVGLVVYRDRGDSEPTRMVPLTADLDAIHRELMDTPAVGGGDEPEDVNAGLALAVREMNWSAHAAHMLFLVGDAPPHDYPGQNRQALLEEARHREIEISTIECSGMNPTGHALWASIAEETHGEAQVLTYSQQMRLANGQMRTVLTRGGERFVATRALSESERSEDANVLVSHGAARRLTASDEAALDASSFGAERGRGGAPAAAAPMTNNISDRVTRRVQHRAADMGVAY